MDAYDVISITLGILDQIEVRGKDNISAMNKAINNLEVLKGAIENARRNQHDDHNQQG